MCTSSLSSKSGLVMVIGVHEYCHVGNFLAVAITKRYSTFLALTSNLIIYSGGNL